MLESTNDFMFEWITKAKRLCDCKPNHINCLTAKEWVKAMIGVWEFTYEKRDIRNKKIHPATFPISMAKKVIELFTHKGNIVLDPFNGTGTTLLACRDLNRHGIGFDLKKEYCRIAKERVKVQKNLDSFSTNKEINFEVINDDAINVMNYIPKESIDLVFTSPPYANILNKKRSNKSKHTNNRKDKRLGTNEQYSEDPRDLGTQEPKKFIETIKQISKKIFQILKPNRHYVINIRDVVPFFIQPPLIKAMEDVHFRLKNLILWDKRKLIQNMGIFGWPSNYITLNSAYEYIFDFIKPKDNSIQKKL
ncbi:MAG: DNA methyltransferase [Promethearchaeota archaeon]